MLLLDKTLHFDGLESGSLLNEGKEAFDIYIFLTMSLRCHKIRKFSTFHRGLFVSLCFNFQQFSCYFEFQ